MADFNNFWHAHQEET